MAVRNSNRKTGETSERRSQCRLQLWENSLFGLSPAANPGRVIELLPPSRFLRGQPLNFHFCLLVVILRRRRRICCVFSFASLPAVATKSGAPYLDSEMWAFAQSANRNSPGTPKASLGPTPQAASKTTDSLALISNLNFLLPFSAQKSHVKPWNHITSL